MVSQSSRRSTHSGRNLVWSAFLQTWILRFWQIIIFVSSLKIICDHWSTDQCNSLAVNLKYCDFFLHYSTFVPFQKQSSSNCSRLNITANSLIKSCCYIFQSLSSVCFHATKKNSVIPWSLFSHTPTSWQVFNVSSFSHPLQKFMDCSTIDACHILYFIARKTFIWQI